jgi:hypothetical protein
VGKDDPQGFFKGGRKMKTDLRFLWLSAAAVFMGASEGLSARVFRSDSSASLNLYLPQTAEENVGWGLNQEETILIRPTRDAGWFLKAYAASSSHDSAIAATKAGLGFSIPFPPRFYLNLTNIGTWLNAESVYVNNILFDMNYEGPHTGLSFSGNLGLGQDVLTSQWGVSAKHRFRAYFAAMSAAQAGWDLGAWGYAELFPDSLKLRLGASAGSFHRAERGGRQDPNGRSLGVLRS